MAGAMHQRDLIGTVVVDYDETVDVRRLRRERLQRLQAEMASADLGGMVLFDPINVRYAIGVRANEIAGLYAKFGYLAVVPREGKPILFWATGLEPPVIDGDAEPRDLHSLEFWETGPNRSIALEPR